MERKEADRYNQLLVGRLLRIGVLVSMAVVAVGGIIYLIAYGGGVVDYSQFTPDMRFVSIGLVFKNLVGFHHASLIQLGIILLIFTPIARVLLATVSFWFEKDYLYVAIGLAVLAVISLSLAGGFAH